MSLRNKGAYYSAAEVFRQFLTCHSERVDTSQALRSVRREMYQRARNDKLAGYFCRHVVDITPTLTEMSRDELPSERNPLALSRGAFTRHHLYHCWQHEHHLEGEARRRNHKIKNGLEK